MIEANNEVNLEITWSPSEAGSWREVLQLTDGRRVKYEIPLVMQCQDLRNKDSKLQRNVRKPLISKSNTTQQLYSSKNIVRQKESDKYQIQPRSKRTRIDTYHDEPDKENMKTKINNENESIVKKQRKEILNATSIISTDSFVLTPVKFNKDKFSLTNISENVKYSKTLEKKKDYNFSPQENFLLMEERIEMKTLRRETYVKTPNRRNLLTIDEKSEIFDDSLSPAEEKFDFSHLIDNINFTPRFSVSPENSVFEFSPNSSIEKKANRTFEIVEENDKEKIILPPSPKRKVSTFLKPTRLANNFDALTPITPAPQRKVEFASSSLISMDCSNFAETPRRVANISYRDLDTSTVKEILEADMWIKPENIVPVRREKRKEILNDTFELTESKSFHLEISPPKAINSKASCILEISPPKAGKFANKSMIDKIKRISPTKSGKILKKKQICNSFKNSIPGVRISNLSLAGISRKKMNQSLNVLKETSVKLHDPNDFVTKFCNPDPFAATMTEDPFLSSTLYYDEKWVYHQELEFKKWLNALMTPPEHLNTDVDTNCVDIGKVWQSSRQQEDCVLAESKESISARIHTDSRLNTLRKAACMMFHNPEVSNILSRTTVCVEKGILLIRQDRDLHRNIGLQKLILELFLSYNPLWLRIGLETIYGETIPLRSNNDLIGLTRFLLRRFFADQFIIRQHSHPTIVGMKLPTFTQSMNKFMLKKFLLFVFFLDFAKTNKLIGHDPCLFHKKATHKDTRSILLSFSREVLSGMGDITRVLKAYGYIVSYKQTYLDEFDYAVKDMSSDLRDGVRLCRTMELITGNRNLTCQCRVPAISRLQKVHNVNIALKALLDSGYNLAGEIDAKSISDGHREKTLSLLWQIIYKFQKPRFEKAATIIQNWWRSKLWYIRVRNLLKNRKINAACCIQRGWRCYKSREILKKLQIEYEKKMEVQNSAASVIQKFWYLQKKGKEERENFLKKKQSSIKIQNWWRRIRETRPYIQEFRNTQNVIIFCQRIWRSKQKTMIQRNNYLKLIETCKKVQIRYRAKLEGKKIRESYQNLKNTTLIIQRRYRAVKLMQNTHESYQNILQSAKKIQIWWRGILQLKNDRNKYLLLKYAVGIIEKKWLQKKIITPEQKEFHTKKMSAIIIQRNWRKYSQCKSSVQKFQQQRKSSIILQSYWRGLVKRREYQVKKSASIKIQNWYRSIKLTKQLQNDFQKKKSSILILQKNLRMILAKRNYWQMKSSALIIENWYENIQQTRTIRHKYLEKKSKVQIIENWWLNHKKGQVDRKNYLELKSHVIFIQRQWRGKKLMESTLENYQQKRKSAILIQSYFRMWQQRKKFRNELKSTIFIQKKWRSILLARKTRNNYENLRYFVIIVQNRWRAKKAAQEARKNYLETRKKIIKIQKQWRCYRERKNYLLIQNAIKKIQNRWRHKSKGDKIRRDYLQLKQTTIYLQNLVRNKQKEKKTRENYQKLVQATIIIQKTWKARKVRREYEKFKKLIILLQATWRMKQAKKMYNQKRKLLINVQRKWRAKLLARKTRRKYNSLQLSTIVIQRHWRQRKLTNEIRKQFLDYRHAIIVIQSVWRMKREVKNYKNLLQATRNVQRIWRGKIRTRQCRREFESLKSATITLQRQYRANKLGKIEKHHYSHLRMSIILIQRKWRSTIETRKLRQQFQNQQNAAKIIQNHWRSLKKMRETRKEFLKTKMLIINLQRKYRANVITRKIREKYQETKNAVLMIQKCWRFVLARRAMKEQLEQQKLSVKIIENWWLNVLRTKIIREAKREEMRKLNFAATKIQAIWRGFCVRRMNTARMSELRIRTENAAKQAIPAETLANRLEDSINVFLFSNDLGRLSMCLSSLGE